MKLTKLSYFLVILDIIAATIYLMVYGFVLAGDSEQWLGATNFFSHLPQLITPTFNVHFLLCPIVPIVTAIFSRLISLNLTDSYLVLAIITYVVNTTLLFRLSLKITKDKMTSLLAAVLFIIDFQTLHLTMTVLADGATWMMLLIIANHALDLTKKLELTVKDIFLAGLISSAAILTKLNLGFITLIYPLIFLFSYKKKKISYVLLWGIITSVGTVPYFWWLTDFLKTPFQKQLLNTVRVDGNVFVLQIREFISAFLYLVPLLVIGLVKFRPNHKIVVAGLLFLTLLPVVIWPSIEARYSYVSFWFFFPLAAVGIRRVFKEKKVFFIIFFLALCFLNFSRNYMVTNRLSHGQFLQLIYNRLAENFGR